MCDFNKYLKKKSTNWENPTEGISIHKEDLIQIKNESHQPKLAQVIALINTSDTSINTTPSISSLILDPMFPPHEACSDDSANTIFGRQFGITYKISDKKWFIRRVTNDEMLHVYSIPIGNDNYVIDDQYDILDDLITFRIPWTFWSNIIEDGNRSNNMLDYFTLGDITQCETDKCYFNSKSPEILDWSKAYMNDNEKDMILKNTKKPKNVTWTEAHLKPISLGYKTTLK